jgi:VanZ family protein
MPTGPRVAIISVVAAIYLGMMFLGTHLPLGVQEPVAGADKLVHALMYAGLAAVVLAGLGLIRPPSIAAAACVVLLIAAYAALDEWTQQWVPSRSADPWDWAADVAGASLGAVAFLLVRQSGQRQRKRAG